MIAMALACDPKLLIADEPTTALDVSVQAQILALLRELMRERRMALAVVTHDMGVIAALADEVLVMRGGQVVERAAVASLLAAPRHEYTRALLAATPRVDASVAMAVAAPPRSSRRDHVRSRGAQSRACVTGCARAGCARARHFTAVDSVSFDVADRRSAGNRRRIRLRQVDTDPGAVAAHAGRGR